MKSQAESWKLFRAFSDIDEVYIIEAMQGSSPKGKKDLKPASVKGKVVKFLPRVLLAAALIAIPASAMGDSSLLDTARAKTAALDLSNEELQAVCDHLASQHVTAAVLAQLEPLKINESGLVFGFDSPFTDLVITPTDDGRFGYAYRKDFFGNVDDPPSVKFYKLTHTHKVAVFEEDGQTRIGHFTCSWDWPPETPHIGWR